MPPTNPDIIVKEAAKSGWEPALLAFVFLVILAFLVWLIRYWMAQSATREERMAKRIDSLEDQQRNDLHALALGCKEALDRNSNVIANLQATLDKRPCLLEGDNQKRLVDAIAKEVKSAT